MSVPIQVNVVARRFIGIALPSFVRINSMSGDVFYVRFVQGQHLRRKRKYCNTIDALMPPETP